MYLWMLNGLCGSDKLVSAKVDESVVTVLYIRPDRVFITLQQNHGGIAEGAYQAQAQRVKGLFEVTVIVSCRNSIKCLQRHIK